MAQYYIPLVGTPQVGGSSGGSSGGGVLVIHETVSGSTHTLDKTWQEIYDADLPVFIYENPNGGGTVRFWTTYFQVYDGDSDEPWKVAADGIEYFAESADGYPSYTE